MSQAQNLIPDKDHINIELECRKSEILHHLMRQSWGLHFASPIEEQLESKKGLKVLDVACGCSGIWLLQLSKDYPLAKFVGLDKLPIFPKDYPQDNLQFVQGDIVKGLPFEDNSFDLVHMRFVMLEFGEEQWEEIVIKELVRVCKPGGWIELLEIEEIKFMSPTFKRLMGALACNLRHKEVHRSIGGATLIDDIPEFLDDTDKIDAIYVDERFIPIGNWGGDIGKLASEMQLFIFYAHNSIKWLEVSGEEYKTIVEQFEKELEQYHSYLVSRRVLCQKKFNL